MLRRQGVNTVTLLAGGAENLMVHRLDGRLQQTVDCSIGFPMPGSRIELPLARNFDRIEQKSGF